MTTPQQGSTLEEALDRNTRVLLQTIQQLPVYQNAPPQSSVNPFPVAGTPVGPVGPPLFPGLAPHRGPVTPLPQWQLPMMPFTPGGLQDCYGLGAPGCMGQASMFMPGPMNSLTPLGQAPTVLPAPAVSPEPIAPPVPGIQEFLEKFSSLETRLELSES